MTTPLMLYSNPAEYWDNYIHICGDGKVKVNKKCKINSKYCSEEDSEVEGLCKWHRLRMAKYSTYQCPCGTENIFCVGDWTGRNIFREFYSLKDIPVMDSIGELYCCGNSQNRDSNIAHCGQMKICEKHLHLHPNHTPDEVSQNI